MIPDKIYLDYAASTPVSQEVINEMLPFLTNISVMRAALHINMGGMRMEP